MPSPGAVGPSTDTRTGAEEMVMQVLCPEDDSGAVNPPRWTYFHKPIVVVVIGGLLLGAGSALSLLHSAQLVNMSYTAGTVCLSIGLMFLVTGLVWLPVIRQRLQRKGLTQKEQA